MFGFLCLCCFIVMFTFISFSGMFWCVFISYSSVGLLFFHAYRYILVVCFFNFVAWNAYHFVLLHLDAGPILLLKQFLWCALCVLCVRTLWLSGCLIYMPTLSPPHMHAHTERCVCVCVYPQNNYYMFQLTGMSRDNRNSKMWQMVKNDYFDLLKRLCSLYREILIWRNCLSEVNEFSANNTCKKWCFYTVYSGIVYIIIMSLNYLHALWLSFVILFCSVLVKSLAKSWCAWHAWRFVINICIWKCIFTPFLFYFMLGKISFREWRKHTLWLWMILNALTLIKLTNFMDLGCVTRKVLLDLCGHFSITGLMVMIMPATLFPFAPEVQ